MFIRKYTRGAQCCSYSPYAMWSIPHEVFQTFCKLGIRQITPSWPPGYSPVFSRSLQTATQIYKIFCKPENFGGLHLQDLCFFKIKMAKTTSRSVFLAIIFSGLRSILHPYIYDTKIPSEIRGVNNNLSNYILPGGDEQSEEDSSHWKVADIWVAFGLMFP